MTFRLLEQLRQSRAVQITIATRYVFVDQATMDQLGMVGVEAAYVKDFTFIRTKEGETRYESQTGTMFNGLVLDL